MAMTPATKRVQIARTTLLLDQPFFGVLALALELIEDSSCPTAWTDGKSLGYNPTFVLSLSIDEMTALIAHEVMHCACGHPWRRDGRDMWQWNVAADYAINGILTEARFVLPKGALLDQQQYGGKWAEWIYDRLPKQQQQQTGGTGAGKGSGQQQPQPPTPNAQGEVRDAPTGADAPSEQEWQQNVQQSLRSAARGTLPASLREQISDAAQSRQDWRSLLRRYVQEITRSDYSWSRPNVRYIPSGLYLPALHERTCGRLALAIDTSGSIDLTLLAQFAAEVRTIADELQPTAVDVIYCDARVHRVDHFERGDTIELSAIGRGGTSFVPVFDHINASGDIPACLIYLTDLDGTFPATAPDYPVIWAAYGTCSSAPFGDTVQCE